MKRIVTTTFAIVANGKNFGFSEAKSVRNQIKNAKIPQTGVMKNKSVANKFEDKSKDKIVPIKLEKYANVVPQSSPPSEPPHAPPVSEILFRSLLIFRPPFSDVYASR